MKFPEKWNDIKKEYLIFLNVLSAYLQCFHCTKWTMKVKISFSLVLRFCQRFFSFTYCALFSNCLSQFYLIDYFLSCSYALTKTDSTCSFTSFLQNFFFLIDFFCITKHLYDFTVPIFTCWRQMNQEKWKTFASERLLLICYFSTYSNELMQK